MTTPRILAFGGSLRRDSFNQKLAAIAATGAEVTLIALRDFPLSVSTRTWKMRQACRRRRRN
jgi:NAD(P)H-dependent FMN reductase